MKELPEIEGVLFDMDGLLFDSERLWDSLWPICCEKLNLPLPPDSFYREGRGMAGKNYEQLVQRYYPDTDVQQIIHLLWAISEEGFAKGVPVKPGAPELLAYLQNVGIPCIVASSSPRGTIEQCLRTAKLEHYFAGIVCGQDVKNSKPDPDIFLLAAQRLGVDIHHCLVLEDSPNGIRAGYAAGAVTIMVPDMIEPNAEICRLYSGCCRDLFEVKKLFQIKAIRTRK